MPYWIAGVDVHKKMLAVVIADVTVAGEFRFVRRRVATSPSALRGLAEWLVEQEVEEVVMESTAQYWRPVWETLERSWQPIRQQRKSASSRSGALHLAQAQSNRGARGRKRDFPDAERLVKRLVAQELTLSFVTGAPRWVAYTSDETGRPEVYVREFPLNAESDKWPVSKAGGTNPRWRRDGKELFFAAPDGTVVSVEAALGATFRAGEPKALFRVPAGLRSNWDLTADGERFLVLIPQDAPAPLTVWQNWHAVLFDR